MDRMRQHLARGTSSIRDKKLRFWPMPRSKAAWNSESSHKIPFKLTMKASRYKLWAWMMIPTLQNPAWSPKKRPTPYSSRTITSKILCCPHLATIRVPVAITAFLNKASRKVSDSWITPRVSLAISLARGQSITVRISRVPVQSWCLRRSMSRRRWRILEHMILTIIAASLKTFQRDPLSLGLICRVHPRTTDW